jgi:hypothetical protein
MVSAAINEDTAIKTSAAIRWDIFIEEKLFYALLGAVFLE